jgi:hypothetical protein
MNSFFFVTLGILALKPMIYVCQKLAGCIDIAGRIAAYLESH